MVSIILPTYNEVENIRQIIPLLHETLLASGLEHEIIVVDDDSPDGTAREASLLKDSYPVVVCKRVGERGLATAVLEGFRISKGEICVVMDADMSHPVAMIPEMVYPILSGVAEATVGTRYMEGGGSEEWPWYRRLMSHGAGWLARGVTRMSDPTSGFMAIRKSLLKGVELDPVGWKIVLEVIVKTNARFLEIPIVFAERRSGTSKLNIKTQMEYLHHLWKLYRYTHKSRGRFPASCYAILSFAVASLVVAGVIQFGFATVPSDADTAYHAAVGQLIRHHGILQSFPWTPMSWLAEHYADKELLFHLFFVPFSGLGWITASKIVGTVAGAAVLMAGYLVLRAEGVRLAPLWALLPLAVSSAFLYRFALVRPHLLSIALAVVVLWAASRERLRILALAAFVYPWAYVAWMLPLLLAGVAEVARIAGGERPRWKPAAVAAAAMVAGVVVHPNAENLVRFMWLVIGDVLIVNAWGGRQGVEMGTEFNPFSWSQWTALLILVVAIAAAALILALRQRRVSNVPLAFALTALAFGLVTVRTARFTEYFVPFSVMAFALALATFRKPIVRFVPIALLAIALVYQGAEEARLLARLREWPNRIPSHVAKVMRAGIPVGSQVFTCEWGLTGNLMLALPDRRFLVALDPTLFQAKDPELYKLWYSMTRRPPRDVAQIVRERFGARYVACFYDEQFLEFNERLASEPGVRTLLVSEDWNVYDLEGTTTEERPENR